MSDEIIATFEKNSKEEVRVTLNDFQGKRIFHIRAYYKGETGEWLPGKGIALSTDRYRDLAAAILQLGEKLIEEAILT